MSSTIKRRHSTQPARFPNAAESFHSQLATLSSLNSPYLYSNVVTSSGPNCCPPPERRLRDSAQIVRSIPNNGNSQQCPILGGHRLHKASSRGSKLLALITMSTRLVRQQTKHSKLARQYWLARFRARKNFIGERPAVVLWCTYRLTQTSDDHKSSICYRRSPECSGA